MSVLRYLLAVCALSLVHFGTYADETDVTLRDLVDTPYQFTSGFRRSANCETELFTIRNRLERALSGPILNFKKAPVSEKIKTLHAAADAIHQISFAVVRDGSREMPEIFGDRQLMQPLALRLKFLTESSQKKLTPHTRELLTIGFELTPVVGFIYAMDAQLHEQLTAFLRLAIDLKPDGPEEKVDHDLRAIALGNLSVLLVSNLQSSRQPVDLVKSAMEKLLASLLEEEGGHDRGYVLESALMFLYYVVGNLNTLPASPEVERSIVPVARACRTLSTLIAATGDTQRLHFLLAQIQLIRGQPSMIFLPDLMKELTALQNDFQRPSDPMQVH